MILCGVFLDPVSAFLAAGIGSCMADLLGGYFIYVPITFVIKDWWHSPQACHVCGRLRAEA